MMPPPITLTPLLVLPIRVEVVTRATSFATSRAVFVAPSWMAGILVAFLVFDLSENRWIKGWMKCYSVTVVVDAGISS